MSAKDTSTMRMICISGTTVELGSKNGGNRGYSSPFRFSFVNRDVMRLSVEALLGARRTSGIQLKRFATRAARAEGASVIKRR